MRKKEMQTFSLIIIFDILLFFIAKIFTSINYTDLSFYFFISLFLLAYVLRNENLKSMPKLRYLGLDSSPNIHTNEIYIEGEINKEKYKSKSFLAGNVSYYSMFFMSLGVLHLVTSLLFI